METIKKPIDRYILKKTKGISCRLCPNNCTLAEGSLGICNTRVNIKGRLYSTAYGYPCSINLDPIEKKPLYHFYPGQRILSLGTYGCNLSCKGCQNFDITRHDMENCMECEKRPRYVKPEDVVDFASENDVKMIAYTYNEPTIFFEYMIDISKLAKKRGIKNVIVSNGYINPEPLKELCKYIDAANIDLKGIDEDFYRKYCGAKLAPVLETIRYIHKKGIWLELTNLLITGLNDSDKDIKGLCRWITSNIGSDVPLHFSRFYPYYKAENIPITTESTLNKAKDIAIKEGIRYVYIGNLGLLDRTRCHICGNIVIERDYDRADTSGLISVDKKNICRKCKTRIPGVF